MLDSGPCLINNNKGSYKGSLSDAQSLRIYRNSDNLAGVTPLSLFARYRKGHTLDESRSAHCTVYLPLGLTMVSSMMKVSFGRDIASLAKYPPRLEPSFGDFDNTSIVDNCLYTHLDTERTI